MATFRDKKDNCKMSRDAYDEALKIFKQMGLTQLIIKTKINIKNLSMICTEEEK